MDRFRKTKPEATPAPRPAAPPPTGKPVDPETQLRRSDPLLRPLDPEPDGVPRQRGHLPEKRAVIMRAQLQIADVVRQKVLAPNLSLDFPLERTEELEQKATEAVHRMLESGRVPLPGNINTELFTQETLDEIFGYGPLQRFINSDIVSEIMVNGPYVIFIERAGRIMESGFKFLDDDHVERIIKRIVRPLGRLADSEHPLVDARLPDGSRVNAVLRPVTLDGPSLSIRKFSKNKLTVSDLIRFGAMTEDMATFLEAVVVSRQNVIVSGGTGSGKTTLINCLSAYIPEHERTVTIEDAAELQFNQRNVVRLETKKPTPEAPNEIDVRDCVRNALRMRPERIVVGECRGGEALDMLQAMNTGHDGSMTTIHSNDPRACISRLETLVTMAGDMPIQIVRKQIADSINFIVQTSRLRDGSRKVTHITEVAGMEGDTVVLSDIFRFLEEGDTPDGKLRGAHASMGVRPRAEVVFKQYGYNLPAAMFLRQRPGT
jgi:pilus assembly protein CpaF